MNSLLLALIIIPAIEIYLFIKIGASIGAFNTVLLIFFTAFIGIYYARAQGLNTLNQGIRKMIKEQLPIYELMSGALIAVGAIFLIIPGFATDLLGFLIIFPPTRKLIFKKYSDKQNDQKNYKSKNNEYIEGEFRDLDDEK
ncbi:FxsA family protein [Candidatus Pelagibacter sp.]|nr:FxsA family protein [Candidatus Pelagibacter sp.]|tara:strand:- start:2758 stop:3180 length:423 start_codon:yes stop_codon:yes gene_type:complete